MPKYNAETSLEPQKSEGVGVLMVNLGTPTAPTNRAVRRYLRQFLSDRRIVELPRVLWWLILYGVVLPLRPRRSAKLYQKIWREGEGSPLLIYSKKCVDAVRAQCALLPTTSTIHIELAMRYGEPSIAASLDKLREKQVQHLLVIPLFPQYSATTTASVFDEVSRYFRRQRWLPDITFVTGYHDQPEYITALTNSIRQHWQQHGAAEKLLISFHGIPQRNVEKGDPYYRFCQQTANLVAKTLGLHHDQWQLVFQSRFGAQPWLQPYCDETLRALPKQGVNSVDIICPGFAADCLETLEEVSITNREIFEDAGGKIYRYIPALNDHVDHIKSLTALINDNV